MGPGMRRRGPGLVGTMARTAVIAGTASAVSGNVQNRQQQKFAQQQAEAQAAAPAAAPAPMSNDDQFAEIEKLGDLMQKGFITQEEFDAKKRQILGL